MKAIKKLLFRQAERRLRKIPLLYRGQAKFNLYYPGKYEFGIGSYGLPKVLDWNEGAALRIGSYCSIATDVQILLGGHHRTDWITTYPLSMLEDVNIQGGGFSRGDVVIGSDVWLCTNTMILSGVSIGHGAVVSAGAVVTRDVEPYSIVAGNPARHVRWRFDEATRSALLDMAWWDWPAEEVVRIAQLLSSSDIAELLAYAARRQ